MSRDYSRTSDTLVTKKGRKKSAKREENALREGAITGQRVEREKNLSGLEKDYLKIPETLRAKYAADAAADGLAPTDNFNGNSMDSALQAGGRGARVENQARQNALQAALGLEVKPIDSATNANTGGVPGSTAQPTAAVLPAATAPSVTTLDEEEPVPTQTNKQRQRALANAAGAQPV